MSAPVNKTAFLARFSNTGLISTLINQCIAFGNTVSNEFAAHAQRLNNALMKDGSEGLRAYTVASLPSATNAGGLIYVSDESGGSVLAFSDGTNWRRVTDRAIVS